MHKTDFYYAIVGEILFDNCILDDSNFAQIEMTDGALNTCPATHVQFCNVTVSRASIKDTPLDYSNFYIACTVEIDLYRVIAPHVNSFKADLSFPKLDLTSFEHADLSRVDLNKATPQSINLTDSKLPCAWLTSTFLEMVICTGSNIASVNFNSVNLSNCHFNRFILTKACIFNTRLYRANLDEASVRGMSASILHGKENIPIDSDTPATLQKFFEEGCTSHIGMSQTEDNINAVAMKTTADTM